MVVHNFSHSAFAAQPQPRARRHDRPTRCQDSLCRACRLAFVALASCLFMWFGFIHRHQDGGARASLVTGIISLVHEDMVTYKPGLLAGTVLLHSDRPSRLSVLQSLTSRPLLKPGSVRFTSSLLTINAPTNTLTTGLCLACHSPRDRECIGELDSVYGHAV